MKAVSKFPRAARGLLKFGITVFTIILCSCSNLTYHEDELEYIKNIKPKTGKPLIIAFGDSLTSGFTLDKNVSYPHLLEARLNKMDCPYEVLNFGFNGDTSGKAVSRLGYALNFDNIGIFVLELGANDVMLKKAEIEEIKANLRGIINRVKRKNIKILLCGFETPPHSNKEYSDAIRKMYLDLATENDVPLLPSFMSGAPDNAKFMLPDNIHPNEEGVKIIERNVFEKIEPLLQCGK
ncbi:MAG: GDSL-type esterase/lipase family protein [Pyrinomonadaceae bacterium]|nr:GDSL-type esterase/lipase family protein [Pyrinomonadaceae bacterium]